MPVVFIFHQMFTHIWQQDVAIERFLEKNFT